MSQEGGQRLLQWLLSIAAPVVPTCHLLGAPFVPSINSTLSQYAAAELASGQGYAPIRLTSPRAFWTLSGLPQGDQAQYLTISWSFTGACTVYGYYVSDDTLGVSLWGEAFSSPFVYGAGGGVFAFNPLVQLTIAGTGPYTMLPSGVILPMAGGTIPAGFLGCDGSAVSQVTYASLFQAIGTTWNTFRGQAAPPAGTFRLPLLFGLTLMGAGPAVAGPPATSARVLGQGVGEERHAQTVAELVAHGHSVTDPGHSHSPFVNGDPVGPDGTNIQAYREGTNTTDNPGNTGGATTGLTLQQTGGSTPFNVVQPSAVVPYIISI